MHLSELLETKPVVILDGAMGTELHRHGVDIGLPLWSANALIHAPHEVRNIHYRYLHAGADVITTNTFRSNIRAMRSAGMEDRWEEVNLRAIELAFVARERYRPARPVLVAAGLAPVADSYSPELVPSDEELNEEHGRQAQLLAMFGADILIAETLMTVRESAAVAAACAATGKEFAVSFVCHEDGTLLSGEPLEEAVAAVETHRPAALLVNCSSARTAHAAHRRLRAAASSVTGCYANTGTPVKGEHVQTRHEVDAAQYAACSRQWIADGARIVGGCCGTTPEHIELLTRQYSPETIAFQEREIEAYFEERYGRRPRPASDHDASS